MNESEAVILGLIFVLLIRVLGFIISLEFFKNLKDTKFIKLILGWCFWIVGGAINLSAQFVSQVAIYEILILFNTIFSAMGDLFLLVGILSYFGKISNKIFISLNLLFILGPILAYFFYFYREIIGIISVIRFSLIILFTVYPLIRRHKFQEILSAKTYNWFLFVAVFLYAYIIDYFFLISQGKANGGIVNAHPMELILYFFLLNAVTMMIVILVLHIEYDLTNLQRFELKDTYSHDLGNILQVIYSAAEIMKKDQNFEMLEVIEEHLNKAAYLIKEIRKLSYR